MKNILLILSSVVLMIATSCEKNTEAGMEIDTHPLYYSATVLGGKTLTGGTGMSVKTLTFTELDRVIIDLESDPAISSVDVYSSEANVAATVTLSSGSGTLNAALADMGLAKAGTNKYIGFHYEFGGYKANETAFLKTVTPWALTVPDIIEDTTRVYAKWELKVANGTISDVTISVKVNHDGTPTDHTAQALAGSIMLMGGDYSLGDTLYITGTATAGALTSLIEEMTVIEKWMFSKVVEGIKFTTTNGLYSFSTFAFGTTGHMELIHVPGISLGFSGTDVQFVASDMATYNDNNVNTIRNAYDIGTKISTVIDIQEDEVYIYKTPEDKYGIFKITEKNGFLIGESEKDYFVIELMTF